MLINAKINTRMAVIVTGRKYLFFLIFAALINYISARYVLRPYLLSPLLEPFV